MNEIILFGTGGIFIREIGYTDTSKGWIHPDRTLDYNVFILLIKGRMHLYEDGTEYFINPGEVFFLKKGIRHWGEPKTLPGTVTCWIHFYDVPPETNLKNMHEPMPYTNLQFLTPKDYEVMMVLPKQYKVNNLDMMISKLKSVYDLYISQLYLRFLYLNVKVTELFVDIYRQSKESNSSNTKTDKIIKMLIEYIEHNYIVKIDSKKLSDMFKLNYNYLCTVFKKKTGESITRYHMRVRIYKAAEQLRNSTQNISEVGQSVGYSDPLYFSRVFRSIMGESPSQYISNLYD